MVKDIIDEYVPYVPPGEEGRKCSWLHIYLIWNKGDNFLLLLHLPTLVFLPFVFEIEI